LPENVVERRGAGGHHGAGRAEADFGQRRGGTDYRRRDRGQSEAGGAVPRGQDQRDQFPGGAGDEGDARSGERRNGERAVEAEAGVTMLKVGDKAPEIRVQTDAGEAFKLSDLKGRRVVLYFYPKADTPGCTTESCEFRDAVEDFGDK